MNMQPKARSAGIPIAVTPFPLRAFWLRSRLPLRAVFSQLYPHTAGHSLSGLYDQGRIALYLLFEQLKQDGYKTKVILPAYGAESLFYATIAAKLQIVLCDVDLQDTLFDLNQLEDIVRQQKDNILAVVIPYNWGMVNLEKTRNIHTLLAQNNILWIDDFAQTQPLSTRLVNYHKRNSYISLFSFTGTKILSCLCGGLLAFSSDASYALQLERSKNAFHEKTLFAKDTLMKWWSYKQRQNRLLFRLKGQFGIEYDMYPTSIAVTRTVLSKQWERLLAGLIVDYNDYLIKKRTENNAMYRQMFEHTSIKTFQSEHDEALGARYMVVFPSALLRNKCQDALFAKQFWTSRGYVHMIPHVACIRSYLREEDLSEYRFPNARELEQRLLTFPNHYLMNKGDFELVSDVIREL